MQATTRLRLLEQAWPLIARKGFVNTSINDVLEAAHVPKGSFYYYFSSKDMFGQELLQYNMCEHAEAIRMFLASPHLTGLDRMMAYWSSWAERESSPDPRQKCLIVKIGSEVSELSDGMRAVMERGIDMLVGLLDGGIRAGISDGSICPVIEPANVARELFHFWLGNAVAFKIHRNTRRLTRALETTRRILQGLLPDCRPSLTL
ncbi:TetR/AcrR family transcriptional regulator [Gluconacetobacter entanii]|nr:TetR/AcrR family transcriptional regulator [Gluconacetobacter entanii]MCE2578799.1 TetR/AcrR family transcriptional regulator [Komagataeibacter sp. FNDCR1]MCW4581602.1 TetR/AcrR family transcriptional regulator [Gluconacetobacter entanii]MCW4584976.1 TetR/AcrR family transcriptional regulator [Gluconacetobacter entanii]MCW4590689.1 TetR/AcrR family transcriptional regulator [Gluconacetobacter entanii]MCW4593238.1 TetR/AcrR family transcriptional regulator [Gluconacetobacter entanii]